MASSRLSHLLLLVCAQLVTLASGHANAQDLPPTEPGDLSNPLAPAQDCADCHVFLNPPQHIAEPDYAPWMWQGSMMANAARDPVFWAGVAIAHQDAPGETQLCIRCHSPQAFLAGRGDAIAIDELEPGDFEGIGCDLCHRMVESNAPLGNASYAIDDEGVDGKVARRGPWAYTDDVELPHAWSDDLSFLGSSELCGTCHDVTTTRERVDEEGEGMGMPFNEQRTYREWLNSAYAQEGDSFRSCLDCHMPAVADVAGCKAHANDGLFHAEGGRRHDLTGANLGGLEVLRRAYGIDGTGEVDDYYYEFTMDRAHELLSTAAELDVTFPDAVDLREGVESLAVTVTNTTGHKLPSGYAEGRVMWLEVIVQTGEQVIYSSGRWDEAEQHIEDDAQVRRYEAIAVDFDTGTEFHLLRNNHWERDTRLPPRGLIEDVETDPVGDRYAIEDGAWSHVDQVEYRFDAAALPDPTPDDDDEALIRVRLLYLLNTPEYIAFLEANNETNAAGAHVAEAYADPTVNPPVLLAQAETTVPLLGWDAGDDDDPSSTGADGDDDDDDDDDTGDDDGDDDDNGDDDDDSGDDDDGGGDDDDDTTAPGATGNHGTANGCSCEAGGRPHELTWLVLMGVAAWRRRAKFSTSRPPAA
ncbi:MAG: hypothetical protein B7733_01500 [Myxococcales bacterium FL481]|nr:MAG: hypothetical protein B7733_01500 [Myxococcales bacterium FL481]